MTPPLLFTERRFLSSPVRSDSTNGRKISGYAAKFGTRSEDLGGFRETLAPGCFDRALSERQDVRACFNHDPSKILGRVKNGTLVLSQDSIGLRFSVEVAETSYGDDLLASVRRGDVDQCSFAFNCLEDDWDDETDPETGETYALRTVRNLDLLDVSAVTYPAYQDTSVVARNHFPQGIPAELRNRALRVGWKKELDRDLARLGLRKRLFDVINS
jgi:hypothetical protein